MGWENASHDEIAAKVSDLAGRFTPYPKDFSGRV
jgi:hypothetical protein